jgi:hypothetical protein
MKLMASSGSRDSYSTGMDMVPCQALVNIDFSAFCQLASSHPAFLDKILYAYELVGKYLPSFEIFHENTSFPPCHGLIYADILELHGTAYSILHRRGS